MRGVLRFVPVLLLVLAIGWQDDRASCVRQIAPRAALRSFLRDNAEFQSALSRFDTGRDRQRITVVLYGRRHQFNRPELRAWMAERSRANADRLPHPACGKLVPGTH